MYILIAIIFGVALFAGIATVRVGLSKENKEGNPSYDKKTAPNIARLTLFYVAITLGAIVLFVWYVFK